MNIQNSDANSTILIHEQAYGYNLTNLAMELYIDKFTQHDYEF